MSLGIQVLFGSAMLLLCALVHVAAVVFSIPIMERFSDRFAEIRATKRVAGLVCIALLAIVAAHTVQIWVWALAFLPSFETFNASFYFAIITYTTVGYGDIVLGDGARIFGAFAAITGMLTFGISTAFLVGLIVRLMPHVFGGTET